MADTTRGGSAGIGTRSLLPNVLGNWTSLILTVAATLVTTPFVVGHLQEELYGVWTFLNGLVIYSDLLYAGLGAALIRQVAAFSSRGDQVRLNRVSSVVLSIYGLIGLLCLGAFMWLGPHVPDMFAHPLGPAARLAATRTCVLLGVQLMASFVGSAFSGILFGQDRNDLISVIRGVAVVGRTIAILTLLDTRDPLLGLATITAGIAVAETIALGCVARLVDRQLVLRPVVPTRPELRELYGFGLQSFVVLFALTLISYTDTTVIGVLLGASAVAFYALPLQLVEYVRVIAGGTSGVLLPRLTVMAEQGDLDGLRAAYLRVARVTMTLASFCTANLLFLASPFLTLWVGPQFGVRAQWIVAILSTATWVHILAVTVPMGFYQARRRLVFPAIVLTLEAVANLGLSVALAPRLGILGVAIGTLIPALLVGGLVLPRFLSRDLALAPGALRRALIPAVGLYLAVAVTQWAMHTVVPDTSYAWLAVRTLLTVPPAMLAGLVLFPEQERAWLRTELGRLTGLPVRVAGLPQPRQAR